MKLIACVLAFGLIAPVVCAQPLLQVTQRNRFIEGVGRVTHPGGASETFGPIRNEGPDGGDPAMPPFFPIDVNVPGPINVHGMQEGGFNGNDSIELHAWNLNLNGDAPEGGSASGTIMSTFGYTFVVSQPLDYVLQGMLHTMPPMGMGYARAHFSLTGPGVSIDLTTTDGVDDMIMLDGMDGQLAPGTYVLLIECSAHIVDFGPGPVNAHADGPLAAIRVVPSAPACGNADFNGDGDFGTDADIEAFFACLAGNCCGTCYAGGSDFNADGDSGTDADIESFFRVLAGGSC
jgi:hypothetical protein